jgi:hypothetical protein
MPRRKSKQLAALASAAARCSAHLKSSKKREQTFHATNVAG